MSQENVEFARKVLGEFNAFMCDELSSEAFAEAYDPEVEIYWHDRPSGASVSLSTSAVRSAHPSRYSSVNAIRSWTPRRRCGVSGYVCRILVFVRSTARGRQSGVPIEVHFFAIYTIQDGEVRRVEYFRHRADALEAAGLSE